MAGSWRTLLDNDAIIAMAGHEAFARGLVYARAGHVLGVGYDPEERVVTGLVRGTHRDAYGTSVQLASDEPGGLRSHRGVCSCPVAMDCKHAAALLVAARTVEDIQQQLQRPTWERALAPLVTAPDPVADVERVPLALELEVQSVPAVRGYPGRHDLRARPVQRGRSGRWVRSGVSWDELDVYSSVHLAEQREWLLALRSAAGPYARYTYPRSPWLSLAAVGTGMWSLLATAPEVGLQLIGSGSRPVAVEEAAATAELRLAR